MIPTWAILLFLLLGVFFLTVAIILFKLSVEKWAEESMLVKGMRLARSQRQQKSSRNTEQDQPITSPASTLERSRSSSNRQILISSTIKNNKNKPRQKSKSHHSSRHQHQFQCVQLSSTSIPGKLTSSHSYSTQQPAYLITHPPSLVQPSVSQLTTLLPTAVTPDDTKITILDGQTLFRAASGSSRHQSPHISGRPPAFVIYSPGASLESPPVGYAYALPSPPNSQDITIDLESGLGGGIHCEKSRQPPLPTTLATLERTHTPYRTASQQYENDIDPYASWCEDFGGYTSETSAEFSRKSKVRSNFHSRPQQMVLVKPVFPTTKRALPKYVSVATVRQKGKRQHRSIRRVTAGRSTKPSFSTISSHGTTREFSQCGTVFNLTAEDGPQGYRPTMGGNTVLETHPG